MPLPADMPFALPVTGRRCVVTPATGAHEAELADRRPADPATAVWVAATRASAVDGLRWDPAGLPVPDLDAVVVAVRRAAVGDRVRADLACHDGRCGERFDLSFDLRDYLADCRPRTPPEVAAGSEPGWFTVAGGGAEFRLPTGADLMAAAVDADPFAALVGRCVRPADVPARTRRSAEAAMQAMAPSLCRELAATCPACGTQRTVLFDVQQFCLRELADRAAFVFQDVDVLARRYHWTEAAILALPQARRDRYAEMARSLEAFG